MRIVLDTVIFVRSQINPFSRWGQLVFDRNDSYQIVVSLAVTNEYFKVLARPEIAKKYRSVATRDLVAILDLIATAVIVEPLHIPAICRDPEDDKILAAALAGEVDFIVSEDKDLLDLGDYEGIRIVNAEAFLALLDGLTPTRSSMRGSFSALVITHTHRITGANLAAGLSWSHFERLVKGAKRDHAQSQRRDAVLINTFRVQPERPDELVEVLARATAEQMPGFISANIHVSLGRTRVVNYAQ